MLSPIGSSLAYQASLTRGIASGAASGAADTPSAPENAPANTPDSAPAGAAFCVLAMGKLVEHPYFSQGKRALIRFFSQHADLAGVEAVEAPHGRNALVEMSLGGSGSWRWTGSSHHCFSQLY